VPGVTDGQAYVGAVDAFTTAVLKKFITYEEGR